MWNYRRYERRMDRYYERRCYGPHSERICQLDEKRHNFCGLDTRNIKLMLNNLVKKSDAIAACYRLLLEAEDHNIKAKDSYGKYRDKHYDKKEDCLSEVIDICRVNNFIFGKHKSDVPGVDYILYFDIPGCKQVSFHTKMSCSDIPDYPHEWDGMTDSTLPKIEDAISSRYASEIKEKAEKLKISREKAESRKRKEDECVNNQSKSSDDNSDNTQERKLSGKRGQSVSTKRNLELYDNIVKTLGKHENTLQWVRVKYCKDGLWASTDNPSRKFNMFIWITDKSISAGVKRAVNPDYYDDYIQVHKVIDTTTGTMLNGFFDEVSAERIEEQKIKRQEYYQKYKERKKQEAIRQKEEEERKARERIRLEQLKKIEEQERHERMNRYIPHNSSENIEVTKDIVFNTLSKMKRLKRIEILPNPNGWINVLKDMSDKEKSRFKKKHPGEQLPIVMRGDIVLTDCNQISQTKTFDDSHMIYVEQVAYVDSKYNDVLIEKERIKEEKQKDNNRRKKKKYSYNDSDICVVDNKDGRYSDIKSNRWLIVDAITKNIVSDGCGTGFRNFKSATNFKHTLVENSNI